MWRKTILFAAYAATIPAANWMIGHLGTECVPNGPCLIPVAPGIMAPSGVLMVGVALVLRDAIQEAGGVFLSLAAIVVGAIISAIFAPAALVVASISAFALSETLDLAVYTPVRSKSVPLAVLVSGIVGAIADSAVFLWIAFGSLDYMAGQAIGKVSISAGVALIVAIASSTRPREGRG